MKRSLPVRFVLAIILMFATPGLPRAQTPNNLAPGAPGKDAQWPGAGKTAVGTSNTLESKVWFTLRGGVMTEIYYPTVDIANSISTQLIIVSGEGSNKRVELESTDTTHTVETLDPRALSFRQVNTARSGAYTVTKTYATDPERHTILIDVQVAWKAGGACPCAVYVYHDPALGNSAMHDSAWTEGNALVASDADKASALISRTGLDQTTNGYHETSDGLAQLRAQGRIADAYPRAADGNVVQVALVKQPNGNRPAGQQFTLALGFGREPDEALKNARASLLKGFAKTRQEYEAGWHEYVKTLRRVEAKYQPQYDMAAMVLKAHEDKTYRGAMIASLSVPWGGGANANEPNVGGYHLVWSRDLYQVATAFYALGDKAAADRALDYLFRVQQKSDGSFPQNSWLDGRPFWGSLQLDEVAFPLILAYQLGRTDNATWTKHVKPAADFIIKHGPSSPQERWEEEGGYSPSTIAAQIAGLVCAAEIARRNDDQSSAGIYLAAADDWARRVESMTATTTGVHGDKNYYLRLTTDANPNDGSPLELNNGAGSFDEREIVDAGFLELVRLGIKSPNDPLIAKSVAVIDKVIKVETPSGSVFYRYNHDGYGEMDDGRAWNFDGKYTGKGRPWPLLSGERGEYELARGERDKAQARLDAMLGFANEGMMIPEQVWDMTQSPAPHFRFGEGTGSATPLAWSMAQFIRLATNLQEGRNIETPDIVAARYVKQPIPARVASSVGAQGEDAVLSFDAGSSFPLRGRAAPRTRIFLMTGTTARELKVDEQGRFEADVPVPQGETFAALAMHAPNGATAFQRARLRGLTADERRREETSEQTPAFVERLKRAAASPVVEGDRATFIHRGAAKRVEVAGDFTGWSPGLHVMRNLPGTDIKYLTLRFAPETRAEYKIIVDGEWILDPLNPNKNDNGVGGFNSNFTMPGYRASEYAGETRALRGTLESLEVPSRLPGGARKVQVYLPRGYTQSDARYPVLYVQDGSDYVRRGSATTVADNLIAQRKIAPFIIVFVDPVERTKEYWANDQFADFMAKELVPLIDGRYRTHADRDSRALLGASLGGVISVWTALRHPDLFARIGGQSSAFQIDDERVVQALARLEPQSARPLRFYLDVGRLEPLLEVNRRVQVMLAAKGFPVVYREAEAGHNYAAWRDLLADAYLALWSN